jgi:hypothetical protein
MFGMFLLALQAAPVIDYSKIKSPINDEGWVFPSERSQRASAVCPVIGRVTAEFVSRKGGNSFTVVGMGRSSGKEDQRIIDSILSLMAGMDSLDVSCWGNEAGQVTVLGTVRQGDRLSKGRVDFLWTGKGPRQLSPDVIYPSVPSN